MYKTKSYYTNNKTTNDTQLFSYSFHRILESIINKDQKIFNKELNDLNKLKLKYSNKLNNNINPFLKILDILKNNFNDLSVDNIENNLNSEINNTELKLEYLQYLISFDINESNGEFLEDKLEKSREILKNNDNKLKY